MRQVYCTDCIYFRIIVVGENDFESRCKYENKCCLLDCEDSKSIDERPFYKEN